MSSYAKHYTAKPIIDMLNKAIQRYPGFIDTEISHIADLIENDAQSSARKRTGRMSSMTTKKKFKKGNAIGYEVSGTAPYTIYQHEGTKWIDADPYILNAFNKHSSKILEIDFKKLFSG